MYSSIILKDVRIVNESHLHATFYVSEEFSIPWSIGKKAFIFIDRDIYVNVNVRAVTIYLFFYREDALKVDGIIIRSMNTDGIVCFLPTDISKNETD